MLLDYRFLWEEGPPPDVDAPRARVPAENRTARPTEDRRAVVAPERRIADAGKA